jgi:hypothetical protein
MNAPQLADGRPPSRRRSRTLVDVIVVIALLLLGGNIALCALGTTLSAAVTSYNWVVAVLAPLLPDIPFQATEPLAEVTLTSAEVTSGLTEIERQQLLTVLVVSLDEDKVPTLDSFTNLLVGQVRARDGKVESVVLLMPMEDRNAFLQSLQREGRKVYVAVQTAEIVTPTEDPTPTPGPTATVPVGHTVFAVPKEKLQSEIGLLQGITEVMIVFVQAHKDANGNTLGYEASPSYGANLLEAQDANRQPVSLTADSVSTLRVSLPTSDAATLAEFAGRLTGAVAIYIYPRPN